MGFKSSHLTLINLKTKKVMNRKFFTWVAGTLLLAASLSTANAQSTVTVGIPATSIPETNPGLYQLKVTEAGDETGSEYLFKLNDDGEVGIVAKDALFTDEITYGHTLWCLDINQAVVGQRPTIDFTNKGHSSPLSISAGDAGDTIDVDRGTYAGWTLSPSYSAVTAEKPLFTYFHKDSVYVFATYQKASPAPAGKTVTVVRAPSSIIDGAADLSTVTVDNVAGLPAGAESLKILLFTITKPTPIILTAAAFNTVLNTVDSAARTLTFAPNATVADSNPWTATGLVAHESGTPGYLNFAQISNGRVNKSAYIRVDTAFTGEYLRFAVDSIGRNGTDGGLTARSTAIRGQYDFIATYSVADDSIAIHVKEVIPEPDGLWYTNTSNRVSYTASPATDDQITANKKLLVSLVGDGSRLTIGARNTSGQPTGTARTKIQLGLGCDGSVLTPNLTSLPEDVYVIKKGDQILAPKSGGGAEWVTYSADNVDPNYIPDYQWVVKKVRTGALDKPMSPVSMKSRGTDGAVASASLQLVADSAELVGKLIRATDFYPVPAAQKGDPFLGSFHPQPVDIQYNTYTLSYLNAFGLDGYYLGTAEGDTALSVTTTLAEYNFATYPANNPVDTVKYGYVLSGDDSSELGLVRLQYIPYTLTKGVDGVNFTDEGRYVLAPTTQLGTVFHLKTVNYKAGVPYYALEALNKTGGSGSSATYTPVNKLKISEDNLWAYAGLIGEQKSSAFAIKENPAPVYRKFDGGEYVYGDGADKTVIEPFGTEENAPLWLKFKQDAVQQYLFESAEPENEYHKGIQAAILGSRNSVEFTEKDNFKYTFYVDTAFVNRKNTPEFKTNTIMPQYLLAVRPDIAPATEDSPALTKASYLFNTRDSVTTESPEYGYDKTTTPVYLGFVDAVHYKDTVYVLSTDKTAAELQAEPAALQAAGRKIYLGRNVQYNAPQANANNDNHKSVVFQFRLATGVNEGRAFYIETTGSGISGGTGWIKVDNGVPVVYTGTMTSATLFNVAAGDEGQAVSNEKIDATSKVRVVSGAGSVNILNASGKKVTVTNILGQNLATQVLNSNNARISLPQGIVVVAVEGEPAVKAIVSR
jgi:hypothetical protein